LLKYLQDNGIDRPTSIPLDQVPPECAETMRQRAAITGRDVPDTFDITEEWLLTARARSRHGERYDFADLAFPEFDQITFDSAESFARRAEELLANPERRESLCRRMQACVNELFTYDALIPKLIAFITDHLRSAAGQRSRNLSTVISGNATRRDPRPS
jgi:hypothetical protein